MSRCRHVQTSARSCNRVPWGAEPFRLFFPWAALLGLAGVLLWPVFLTGHLQFHPGILHSRLMIMGFGGGCVLGFLGTAAPRMLGAAPLSRWETSLLLTVHAAAMIAFSRLQDELGCLLFASVLMVFCAMNAKRFLQRTDLPPPGFGLVLLGLGSGTVGALMQFFHWDFANAFCYRFSRLLVNEAFLLLPLLGVSGFLAPRIFGLPSRQTFPDSRLPPPGWWRMSCEVVIAGLLVLGSLAVEAAGYAQIGPAMRFCVIMGWWSRDIPGLWRVKSVGTQAWMLKVGMGFVAAGPLCLAIDSSKFIAMEHVLFITGFGLTILAVTVRVTFGHSGQLAEAKLVSKPLRWVTWLAILAMSTRVSADYVLTIQNSHYLYAAITWALVTLIWLRVVWRGLKTPDPS